VRELVSLIAEKSGSAHVIDVVREARRAKRLIATCVALVALAVVVSALLGCGASSSPGVSTVEDEPTQELFRDTPDHAVTGYLEAAARAYYSLDSTMVAAYVTNDQWLREDAYIELLRTRNEAVQMNLKSLQFTVGSQSTGPESATVSTSELWQWRIWNLHTRQPKANWNSSAYHVVYSLVHDGSIWKVDGTSVEGSSTASDSVRQ